MGALHDLSVKLLLTVGLSVLGSARVSGLPNLKKTGPEPCRIGLRHHLYNRKAQLRKREK